MITISNPGPQIDSGHIAEIEAIAGGNLPTSYKDFLLKNNGGIPTPDTIDIDGAPGSPTDVQVFFGVGRDVESSNLSWNIHLMGDRLQAHDFLPIACDSGGNIFCLGVSKKSLKRVIYCDLSGAEATFYEMAPDFDAFLEKIRA
jgi:SMI1-KNR4 cell-wall